MRKKKSTHHSYVVEHHTEECQCAYCGMAIYVGERVFLTNEDEGTCSEACAIAIERNTA